MHVCHREPLKVGDVRDERVVSAQRGLEDRRELGIEGVPMQDGQAVDAVLGSRERAAVSGQSSLDRIERVGLHFLEAVDVRVHLDDLAEQKLAPARRIQRFG